MASDIKAPLRKEGFVFLLDKNRKPIESKLTVRAHRFLVDVAEKIADPVPAISDITVSTTANNTAKINELLAGLRTAGILET